jgi:hypothetical protein
VSTLHTYIHARKFQGYYSNIKVGNRPEIRPVLAFEVLCSLDVRVALPSDLFRLIPETLLRYCEVFVVGK